MYKNINFFFNKLSSNYGSFWYFSNLYQTYVSKNFKIVLTNMWDLTNTKTLFIPTFYVRNEYIWQDGFLFDFRVLLALKKRKEYIFDLRTKVWLNWNI